MRIFTGFCLSLTFPCCLLQYGALRGYPWKWIKTLFAGRVGQVLWWTFVSDTQSKSFIQLLSSIVYCVNDTCLTALGQGGKESRLFKTPVYLTDNHKTISTVILFWITACVSNTYNIYYAFIIYEIKIIQLYYIKYGIYLYILYYIYITM